jgi:hypothetical protein
MLSVKVSGPQLRAARALIGDAVTNLAVKVGIDAHTIRRLEASTTPAGRLETLTRLVAHHEAHGVRFVDGGAILQAEKATA